MKYYVNLSNAPEIYCKNAVVVSNDVLCEWILVYFQVGRPGTLGGNDK